MRGDVMCLIVYCPAVCCVRVVARVIGCIGE